MDRRKKVLIAIALLLLVLSIVVNYLYYSREEEERPVKEVKKERPVEEKEEAEEVRTFYIKPKPADGTYIQKEQTITFSFSSAVNPDDVMFALSIYPSADYDYSWFNENTLILKLKNLEQDTDYTISFSTLSNAKDGSVLVGKKEFSYHTVSDKITFSKVIYPGIIKRNCMDCHKPGGYAENISLDTYDDCMQYIVPGKSQQSRFYLALIENKAMDDDLFSQRELQLIKDWIDKFNAEY